MTITGENLLKTILYCTVVNTMYNKFIVIAISADRIVMARMCILRKIIISNKAKNGGKVADALHGGRSGNRRLASSDAPFSRNAILNSQSESFVKWLPPIRRETSE